MGHIPLSRVPALPASISELIRLAPDTPSYYDRVLEICEVDPGMASEVIRLSHSVAVATRVRVSSMRQALILVGPKAAVNHLVGGAMVRVFVPQSPMVRELWERSVWTAVAASRLAVAVDGLDADCAHTTGLLHDLGLFAMACADQEACGELPPHDGANLRARLKREREVFGEDHTAAGVRLSTAWALPPVFRFVIRHHHDDPIEGPDEMAPYARLVALADAMFELREDDASSASRVTARARGAGLEFSMDELACMREEFAEESAAETERLGLPPLSGP